MSEAFKKLTHYDFLPEFEGKAIYKDGVETVTLDKWSEFLSIAKKVKDKPHYFWRGQRCHCRFWRLISSFDRKLLLEGSANRTNELDKLLEKFKEKLSEIPDIKNINIYDENSIWAIGQHYGLSTPLLDWTASPFFGAFFAFFEKGTNCQTKYRVIYGLNMALRRMKRKDERFVDFLDLLKMENIKKLFNQDKRIDTQKSQLTKALNGISVKQHVFKYSNLDKNKDDILKNKKVILLETLVPNKSRKTCLQYLKRVKNITYTKLFPDYSGAVTACKNNY